MQHRDAIREALGAVLSKPQQDADQLKRDLDVFLDEVQPDVENAVAALTVDPSPTNLNTLALLRDAAVLRATRSTCRTIAESGQIVAGALVAAVRVIFAVLK